MPDLSASALSAEVEDGLLAAWAGRGDRQALGELFTRCRQQAHALAVRICGPAAAEDAVQDAFLNAMRQARAWRGGSARGWLLAAVANTARNHLRAKHRRTRREGAVSPTEAAPEPTADADSTSAVREALGELPAHERSALELRYLAGLDLDTVAETLGRPYKTVHSQVERGLERLRGILGRRGITAAVAALPMALVGSVDAAEPPGLASALVRLAASGPRPIAVWLKPVLAVAGLSAVLLGLAWALPQMPAVPPAVVAKQPAAMADPLAAVLDQPVAARLLHDRLDEALAALARALPADSGFRYAIPDGVAASWEGITWIPAAPVPMRQALDAITAQAGLAWAERGGVVVVHPKAADEAALRAVIATLREPPADPERTTVEVDDEGLDIAAGPLDGNPPMYDVGGGDERAQQVLRVGITRPDSLGLIVAAGLDPLRPGLGRQILDLMRPTPGWFHETTEDPFPPQRTDPIRMLAGDPLGEAAVRCLQAHVRRPADLGGVRCQAILAARVATAARAPGAADAIAALQAHDPGPAAVRHDFTWQVALGGCLAELHDPRAVPILVAALRSVREDTATAMRALAAAGAVGELVEHREFAALGWCPAGAGLDAIERRITAAAPPADSGHDEASALLRAGVRSVPSGLARFLVPVDDSHAGWEALGTAFGRCGGAEGAAQLLTWAESGGLTAWVAGQALAQGEDPRALPLLARAVAGPGPGRMTAAAIGLASSRLAGAAAALRTAIGSAADTGRSAELWSAALGGRDDALAGDALADAVRRGPVGAVILRGLKTARTPAALVGGWALAGDPAGDPVLRQAALRSLPDLAVPARDQALNAILGERGGAPELRVMALLDRQAATLPACVAAVRAAAAADPSAWVRASAIYVGDNTSDTAFLTDRLTDPNPQVRSYAAAAFGQTVEDATALATALAGEAHPRVRETIARLLAQNVFVARDAERSALVRAVAVRCLAGEVDPAAKAALEALRDGVIPGPTMIGSTGNERWSRRVQHLDFRNGRTWERQYWPPRQLADDEDPGLPFSDG